MNGCAELPSMALTPALRPLVYHFVNASNSDAILGHFFPHM
jgi:hypothetical protein